MTETIRACLSCARELPTRHCGHDGRRNPTASLIGLILFRPPAE